MNEQEIEERAKRGSLEKFQQVMAKVPKVQPEPYDRIDLYTIPELAKMANVTPKQLFDILSECSHVTNDNGVSAVADSGMALGGINQDPETDEYGVLFPKSMLDDFSVNKGIQDERIKSLMHRGL